MDRSYAKRNPSQYPHNKNSCTFFRSRFLYYTASFSLAT